MEKPGTYTLGSASILLSRPHLQGARVYYYGKDVGRIWVRLGENRFPYKLGDCIQVWVTDLQPVPSA